MTNPPASEADAILEDLLVQLEERPDTDVEAVLREYPRHAAYVRDRLQKRWPASGWSLPPLLDRLLRAQDRPTPAERYRVGERLGAGGMGIVFRAFDVDLDREVALKVITPKAGARQRSLDLANRFLNEAQITGRLQHPNIVPVYEFGALSSGELFYTMKLVEGRTLSEVAGRLVAGEREALEEFTEVERIQIVRRICDALSFAHSLGVVHRDLKPANVMVGRFGEVHVMDWGLAKALAGREGPRARVVLGDSPDAPLATSPGDVFGTPTHMAPEQARGDVEEIDERSDVFGIGSILYHLFAGHAPYEGNNREQVMARACAGRLSDPGMRRAPRPVAREIRAICRKAMAAQKGERYASARELAEDLQAYVEGRPGIAWRENAVTRTVKVVRRHPVLATVVAATLLLLATGNAAVQAAGRERAEASARLRLEKEKRDAQLERTLFELRGQALAGEVSENTTLSEWMQANRHDAWVEEIVGSYVRTLREYGVSADAGDFPSAVTVIEGVEERSSSLHRALMVGLYELVRIIRQDEDYDALRTGIERLIDAAETDPWYRQAWIRYHPSGNAADSTNPVDLDGRTGRDLEWLAALWKDTLGKAAALDVLRRALGESPNFWVHYRLSRWLPRFESRDEALRHGETAVALAPEFAFAHQNLADLLARAGENKDAVRQYRVALDYGPDSALIRGRLAFYLSEAEDHERALEELDEAATLFPSDPYPRLVRGNIYLNRGQLEAALAEFDAAAAIDPRYLVAPMRSCVTLKAMGRYEAAESKLRSLIERDPDYAPFHNALANLLIDRGRYDEAIASGRNAVDLLPRVSAFRTTLGWAHQRNGDFDVALEELSEAVELDPWNIKAIEDLAILHRDRGESAKAHERLDRMVEIDPTCSKAYSHRGYLLFTAGRHEDAEVALRQALDLDENNRWAAHTLGHVETATGRVEDGQSTMRRALRLTEAQLARDPDDFHDQAGLGCILDALGDERGSIAAYRRAVQIDPKSTKQRFELGVLYRRVGDIDAAIAEYERILELDPRHPTAHCNLGWRLVQKGDYERGLAMLVEGHNLRTPDWRYPTERWIHEVQGLIDHRSIVDGEQSPESPEQHVWLARGLARRGHELDCVEAFERVHEVLQDPGELRELLEQQDLRAWEVYGQPAECAAEFYAQEVERYGSPDEPIGALAVDWLERWLHALFVDATSSEPEGTWQEHWTVVHEFVSSESYVLLQDLPPTVPWAPRARRLCLTAQALHDDLRRRRP